MVLLSVFSRATSYNGTSLNQNSPRSNHESFDEWDEGTPFPESTKQQRLFDEDPDHEKEDFRSFPETPWPEDGHDHDDSQHDDAATHAGAPRAGSVSIIETTDNALKKLREAREERRHQTQLEGESLLSPSPPSISESADSALNKSKEASSTCRNLSLQKDVCPKTPSSASASIPPPPLDAWPGSPAERKSRWSSAYKSPAGRSGTPKTPVKRLSTTSSDEENSHLPKCKTPVLTDASKKTRRIKLNASDLAAAGLSPHSLQAPDEKVKAALQKWLKDKGQEATTEVAEDEKSHNTHRSRDLHNHFRGRRSSVGTASVASNTAGRLKARSKSRQRRSSIGSKSTASTIGSKSTVSSITHESGTQESPSQKPKSERPRSYSSSRRAQSDSSTSQSGLSPTRRRRSVSCQKRVNGGGEDGKNQHDGGASPRSRSRAIRSASFISTGSDVESRTGISSPSRRRRSLTCLQKVSGGGESHDQQDGSVSPRSRSRAHHGSKSDNDDETSQDSPKNSPNKQQPERKTPSRSRSLSIRASGRVGSRSKSRTPLTPSRSRLEEKTNTCSGTSRCMEDVLREAGISAEQFALLQAAGVKISLLS